MDKPIQEAINFGYDGAFDVNVGKMGDEENIDTVYAWINRRFIGPLMRLYAQNPVRAIELALIVIRYFGKTSLKGVLYNSNEAIPRDVAHKDSSAACDVMLTSELEIGEKYVVCHISVKSNRQSEIEDTAIIVGKMLSEKSLALWNAKIDMAQMSKNNSIVLALISKMLNGDSRINSFAEKENPKLSIEITFPHRQ